MKRIIALMLVLAFSLGLTACSQVSANDLMKNVPAKAVDVLPNMDAGAAAAADFQGYMSAFPNPYPHTGLSHQAWKPAT